MYYWKKKSCLQLLFLPLSDRIYKKASADAIMQKYEAQKFNCPRLILIPLFPPHSFLLFRCLFPHFGGFKIIKFNTEAHTFSTPIILSQ